MKTLIILFVMIVGLSSCVTYQKIARHTELSEATIRAKLKPGKNYHIKLNIGKVLKIKVTHVDSVNVYGFEQGVDHEGKLTKYSFSDSYSSLHKNTASISVKKFDPLATAAFIIISGVLYQYVANTNFMDSMGKLNIQ